MEKYGTMGAYCRESGMSRNTLGNILSRKMPNRKPSLPEAAKFYQYLGLSKEEFFEIFIFPYLQNEKTEQKDTYNSL